MQTVPSNQLRGQCAGRCVPISADGIRMGRLTDGFPAKALNQVWRTDRTPYLREIMDCLSSSSQCSGLSSRKARRSAGQNAATTGLDTSSITRRDQCWQFCPGRNGQTIQAATGSVDRRVGCCYPPVVVRPARSRDSDGNTILQRISGRHSRANGANSLRVYDPCRFVFFFWTRWTLIPVMIEGEGDPVALAEARTRTLPP